MTILYIILISLGSLIALILIFGFLSPRYSHFERSIEINASEEKVWEQLNNLKNFVHNWSPWTDKDKNAKQTFTGNETGKGAFFEWDGNPKTVGKGSMEITVSEKFKKVTTHIKFVGRGEADATWKMDKINEGKVKVSWDFHSDNKNNPIARIFGRFMEKFMGGDYEQGLNRLKTYCEK